ncbi:hypothetical protein J6590_030406 [Homalodisca vitripennis]|nr:hypothetical protein J6590_030406 [Homalodisca vitripennis]
MNISQPNNVTSKCAATVKSEERPREQQLDARQLSIIAGNLPNSYGLRREHFLKSEVCNKKVNPPPCHCSRLLQNTWLTSQQKTCKSSCFTVSECFFAPFCLLARVGTNTSPCNKLCR